MDVKIDFEDKCDSVNLLFMQMDNRLEYFKFLGSNTIYFLTVVCIILVDCILICFEILNEPMKQT